MILSLAITSLTSQKTKLNCDFLFAIAKLKRSFSEDVFLSSGNSFDNVSWLLKYRNYRIFSSFKLLFAVYAARTDGYLLLCYPLLKDTELSNNQTRVILTLPIFFFDIISVKFCAHILVLVISVFHSYYQ